MHKREDDAEPALCRIHTPGDHSATSAITTTRPSVSSRAPTSPAFLRSEDKPFMDIRLTVGSEPLDVLAKRIWQSVGPSGRNKDYLYELAAAVRELAPESYDSHLFALEVCDMFIRSATCSYCLSRRDVGSWTLGRVITTRNGVLRLNRRSREGLLQSKLDAFSQASRVIVKVGSEYSGAARVSNAKTA